MFHPTVAAAGILLGARMIRPCPADSSIWPGRMPSGRRYAFEAPRAPSPSPVPEDARRARRRSVSAAACVIDTKKDTIVSADDRGGSRDDGPVLKNVDPVLTPELLYVLATMGHGDDLVL